jgi:hypothetical protein
VTVGLACWRWEEPGHPWTECKRPAAKTPQELDERIERFRIRWDAGFGELKTATKTKLIEIETLAYEKARNAR